MKQRLPVLLGVFAIMALSNAIVPVLPSFAEGVALQGAVYSAYFLGAFITVLPAGIASDRFGRLPLIYAGLFLTVVSGVMLIVSQNMALTLATRVLEGIGAGLFIAAAMSWVNSQEDHKRLSGYFFAALNLGLLLGLLVAGWVDEVMASATGGVIVFTVLSLIALLISAFVSDVSQRNAARTNVLKAGRRHFWLFLSAVILIGVTGAIPAIYPSFTGQDPALLGMQLSLMNAATIGAVLIAPRLRFAPVPAIRLSALCMALAVLGSYFTPIAFLVIGAFAGVVMVSQLAFLAGTNLQQGTLIGLFNTSTYAGFTILPSMTGLVAQNLGFLAAFLVVAALTGSVAFTITRCECVEGRVVAPSEA
jgi:MFS family permease